MIQPTHDLTESERTDEELSCLECRFNDNGPKHWNWVCRDCNQKSYWQPIQKFEPDPDVIKCAEKIQKEYAANRKNTQIETIQKILQEWKEGLV